MIAPPDTAPIPTTPMNTPQTPEPPAAGELSDEQLLQMAADAIGYESIALGEYEPGEREGQGTAVEAYGSELIAYARAAIAADRAQRSRQGEQMAEALRRLGLWGGLISRRERPQSLHYSYDVALGVCDWLDAGMIGPLPPLPDHVTREDHSNG